MERYSRILIPRVLQRLELLLEILGRIRAAMQPGSNTKRLIAGGRISLLGSEQPTSGAPSATLNVQQVSDEDSTRPLAERCAMPRSRVNQAWVCCGKPLCAQFMAVTVEESPLLGARKFTACFCLGRCTA